MRPISLHVEGFTCFREPQEILDFSQLSLFAISGPTGAGKSSILDAMAYALYGYVPRLGKHGISDVISAGRDRMTVRLEFAIGARRFRVGRALRRNKAASVVLEELTDSGERLLADKIRDADEHVASLTGLRYESFTQTVLLPQGEFAKFLHSDPGERCKILREVLKLDVYERMRARAEQESREHQQQLRLVRERLEQDYGDATPQHLDTAQTALDEAARLELVARATSEEAARQLQDIQTRFAQSTELTARRIRLEQLDSQRERVDGDRRRLEKARRAATVIPRLDTLDSLEANLAATHKDLRKARAESETAQADVHRHTAAHDRAQRELAAVPALRKQIQALDELRGVIDRQSKVADEILSVNAAVAATTRDHKTASQQLKKAETMTAAAERECVDAKGHRKTIGYDADKHRQLRAAAKDAIRGRELHRQLTTAKRQATVAADKASEAGIAAREAVASADKHKAMLASCREQLTKAETALQTARNTNHAAALRPTLEHGVACPVCEHVVERLPRRLRAPELEDCEHAVAEVKRAESKAARTLEDARDAATDATAQAKERRQVAKERTGETHDIETELAKVSKNVAGVVAVSHRVDILPLEVFETISNEADACADLQQKFEAANERVNRANSALQDCRHRQLQAATSVEQLALRVDEWRARLNNLEEEKSRIASRIAAVTKSPDPAGEREQLAKRVAEVEVAERKAQALLETATCSLARAAAAADGAEKLLAQRAAETERGRTEAHAALAESGFEDRAAARTAALSHDIQQPLDVSIRSYETERHQQDVRIAELEGILAGRYVSEQDHLDAETHAQSAVQAHRAALESLTRSRQEVERMTRLVARASELRNELAALQDHAALSEQLARDLKNDGFQRFLLEEAFRGLVDGASVRMKAWTNRYTFEWDEGAFYAIDHDNGGERRRAETLSGGETFLASLALALELSEEVLRTAGAIHIESLFIDEGFGTLDGETLETVTDAIESLRTGGRMIGIITHIRELTERLPGCIEIEKGLGQSRWQLARVG